MNEVHKRVINIDDPECSSWECQACSVMITEDAVRKDEESPPTTRPM